MYPFAIAPSIPAPQRKQLLHEFFSDKLSIEDNETMEICVITTTTDSEDVAIQLARTLVDE